MQTKNAKCKKTRRVETRLAWSAGDPGSFSPPLSANPCLFWMPKMTYELMDRGSAFSPLVSKERVLSPFSVSVSSLSSGFLRLLVPCSADFICRKWSKDWKAVPASFLFLFSFFYVLFLFFLFYCLPSRPHSNTGEGKTLPLFSVFFFSPTARLSFVFFFSLFFPFSSLIR